jgi:mannose/fructose-specific phosphotransferase system component IIA
MNAPSSPRSPDPPSTPTTTRPVAILVTHGVLGRELVRTVEAILGEQHDAITISNTGLSADALVEKIVEEIERLPDQAPVVLFSDLAAGSCGIASRRAELGGRLLKRIAGVNLPMLLEFFHYRDSLALDLLLPRMEAKGKAGIIVF